MFTSKKDDFVGDNQNEGFDHENQTTTEESRTSRSEESRTVSSQSHRRSAGTSQERSGGLTERLIDIYRNEGDGDLMFQQSDREDNVLQWLQALDMQVLGACRADERLKPLLKMNGSSSAAEDNLLALLSQHFEVSEVGMLARCLCIPLVSIQVGKVTKQGKLLCPTSTRGNLNLIILPSSDFRVLFVGDDGCLERLVTLNRNSESSVIIEEIQADKSGRSFFVQHPCGEVSYFWCAEQSKVIGSELLSKMKDLLREKPSVANLTGIGRYRLDGFAVHLHAYLCSTASNGQVDPSITSTSLEWDSSTQSSSSAKHYRTRHVSGQAVKQHAVHQGSLSPRSNSFKDGAPRNLSSIRTVAKEKFKWRVDSSCLFSAVDSFSISPTSAESSSTSQVENHKLPEISQSFLLSPPSILDSLGKSAFLSSSSLLPFALPLPQTTTTAPSLFSPYYCWCPPCTSTLQYTVTPPNLPISSSESLPLPPVSSLITAARSLGSLSPSKTPQNLVDVSPVDFPAFLPDPVLRVPLSVSSIITVPSSQQIPTFTTLMCDPMVHIPVIDVCTSGQGYLVSAAPTVSTTIPALHSNLMSPLLPDTDSLVEKGARETLRLLLTSTQRDPQLTEVLPSVLTSTNEKYTPLAVYSGTRDVEVIASSITMMGLVSLQHIGCDITKRCNRSEGPHESESSRCSDDANKGSTNCNNDDVRLDGI